jgi:glutathione S-transferase
MPTESLVHDRFSEVFSDRRGTGGRSPDPRDLIRLDAQAAADVLVASALALDCDDVMDFWPEEMVLARTLNSAQSFIDQLGLAAWQDQRDTTISKHFAIAETELAAIAFQAAVSAFLAEEQLTAAELAHLTSGARELLPDCPCWVGRPLECSP